MTMAVYMYFGKKK